MKPKKTTVSKCLLFGLLCMFLSSCEKSDQLSPEDFKIDTDEVSTGTLKQYLNHVTNADLLLIRYNEASGFFSINGIDQISRQDLTEHYKTFKKINKNAL